MQARRSKVFGPSNSLPVEGKDVSSVRMLSGRGGSRCAQRHLSVEGRSGMTGVMVTDSKMSRSENGQSGKRWLVGHHETITPAHGINRRMLCGSKNAIHDHDVSDDVGFKSREECKRNEANQQVTDELIDFKADNVRGLLAAHSECDLARLLPGGASAGSSREQSLLMHQLPTNALQNRTPNAFSSGAKNSTNCKTADYCFRKANAFTAGTNMTRTASTIKTSKTNSSSCNTNTGTSTGTNSAAAAAAAAVLFPASVALQFEVIDAEMVASMERIHQAKTMANLRDEEIESRSRAVVRQRMVESSSTLDREKRKAERRLNALVGLRL